VLEPDALHRVALGAVGELGDEEGADALDALKRIYEETKQAINEGKTIFVGSNKFEDRDDHIIRIEK